MKTESELIEFQKNLDLLCEYNNYILKNEYIETYVLSLQTKAIEFLNQKYKENNGRFKLTGFVKRIFGLS
jgi:hypothetical protein